MSAQQEAERYCKRLIAEMLANADEALDGDRDPTPSLVLGTDARQRLDRFRIRGGAAAVADVERRLAEAVVRYGRRWTLRLTQLNRGHRRHGTR